MGPSLTWGIQPHTTPMHILPLPFTHDAVAWPDRNLGYFNKELAQFRVREECVGQDLGAVLRGVYNVCK